MPFLLWFKGQESWPWWSKSHNVLTFPPSSSSVGILNSWNSYCWKLCFWKCNYLHIFLFSVSNWTSISILSQRIVSFLSFFFLFLNRSSESGTWNFLNKHLSMNEWDWCILISDVTPKKHITSVKFTSMSFEFRVSKIKGLSPDDFWSSSSCKHLGELFLISRCLGLRLGFAQIWWTHKGTSGITGLSQGIFRIS